MESKRKAWLTGSEVVLTGFDLQASSNHRARGDGKKVSNSVYSSLSCIGTIHFTYQITLAPCSIRHPIIEQCEAI